MTPIAAARALSISVLALVFAPALGAQEKRAMTFRDVMQFQSIRSSSISDDGRVVACDLRPDRGDGSVRVFEVDTGKEIQIPRGTSPRIASDGRFVIATVVAPFSADSKKKPKNALAIANVQTGAVETIADVERAILSKNGKFLAWQHFASKEQPEKTPPEKDAKPQKKSKRKKGRAMVLRDLATKTDARFEHVTDFAFDDPSSQLTYVICTPTGKDNGIFHRALADGSTKGQARPGVVVGRFARSDAGVLAFTTAAQDDDGEIGDAMLHIEGSPTTEISHNAFGENYVLRNDTDLSWSKDGKRLLFGVRSKAMEDLVAANKNRTKKKKPAEKKDLFDFETILEDREVDVWHHRDPLINTNQKKAWTALSRRNFRCVYDLDSGKMRRLADEYMTDVTLRDGARTALGQSRRPYLREITWDGRYSDYYLIDTVTGKRRRVLSHHSGPASLSPKGRYLLWYADRHWWIRDNENGERRCLTRDLKSSFANEDHDYPSAVPGYGMGGWYADGSGVILYDRFDAWLFPTSEGRVRCLTAGAGRQAHMQLRVLDLDRESEFLDPGQSLLLTGFHEKTKDWSLWRCRSRVPGARQMFSTRHRLRVIAKAKNADRVLFSIEDYDRFPDLHVAGPNFKNTEQVTKFDSQRAPFRWGTSELIEWSSIDGKRMQGAVIKPGGYDPKKRYPVLVYYYRFFSQRVNEWNQMAVNHRPNFPFYASNGYVVFLPDIRFDVGQPGYAATKCLVPGVQKLIDAGIADPKAIALHGHSWSGYQTAFIITQSNLFACAIAGAPVSNMTSAYGGIRWASGMSRQFQYEKTQSRIGGSLWDYPERYIENSPVFFADRIQTPLLIQFGDEDGAVPWYQGIELYMAMRRLDKPCVFLQYRGEPHHLRKYANKLDYSIKFKEYVDHYCRGVAAPRWIEKGVPYTGR